MPDAAKNAVDVAVSLSHKVEGLSLRDQQEIVPPFDGKHIPLNDFVQDVQNAAALIPAGRGSRLCRRDDC